MEDVFIRDRHYSWLPAKVMEYHKDYALVAVDPPDMWDESTILKQEDTIIPQATYCTRP
jgi:hypothetical protein